MKTAGVDVCGDEVEVVVRLAVAEAPHDITVLQVELAELKETNAGSGSSKGERSRVGAGRNDELDVKLRIGPCRRAKYSSETAVRSSDWRETIPRPAGWTRGKIGSTVVPTCARRDAARRLLTFGVEKSAAAIEATARTRGSDGGGSKNPTT